MLSLGPATRVLAVATCLLVLVTEPAGAAATSLSPSVVALSDQPKLLSTSGGPVMGTPSQPGAVVLTPIFWQPAGYQFPGSGPSSFEGLVGGFDDNLAAGGASPTSVFSTLSQYSSADGVALQPSFSAGAAMVMTTPIGKSGCSVARGPMTDFNGTRFSYRSCVTDAQVKTALEAFLSAADMPQDLAHLYPVFLAPGMMTCTSATGGCTPSPVSEGTECAYHDEGIFSSSALVYSVEPWVPASSPLSGGCGGKPESPNANPQFDAEVAFYAHEIAEAVTDPDGVSGWNSVGGNPQSNIASSEMGDLCFTDFGVSQGHTGALYNQVIGTGHYYLQELWSNVAQGCVQGATPPVPQEPVITESAYQSGTNRVSVVVTLSPPSTAAVGAPLGSVTVSSGTQSCTASALVPVNARGDAQLTSWAQCRLSKVTLPATITASYSGDSFFAQASTTTLSPLVPLVTLPTLGTNYANETMSEAAVTIEGPKGWPAPSGQVSFLASGVGGASGVCSATLAPVSASTSSASCTPSATLPVGAQSLSVSYSDDALYQDPLLPANNLAVRGIPLLPTGSFTVQTARIKKQPEEIVNVALTGVVGYGAPQGDVDVMLGAQSCLAALHPGSGVVSTGSCVITQLAPGSYQVLGNFEGVGNYRVLDCSQLSFAEITANSLSCGSSTLDGPVVEVRA